MKGNDNEISLSLVQKAEQGDIESMIQVADYIFLNDFYEEKDPELVERGLQYYQKAIQAGSLHAMVNCALVYRFSNSVKKDILKAFRLLRLAAEQGDPCACFSLGQIYLDGEGEIPADLEQAYVWFSKAAMAGNMKAYIALSDMFKRGDYVHYDLETSDKLLEIAILVIDSDESPVDYADACYRYAENLYHGFGCKEDIELAKQYYQQATSNYRAAREAGFNIEYYDEAMRDIEYQLELIDEKLKDKAEDDRS